jgi:hypothetical protein
VDRAHVGGHLAASRLLDDEPEVLLHRLLEAAAHLVDGLDLAGVEQGPLHGRKAPLQHADNGVIDHMGLRLRRPFPVVPRVELNQARRDLGQHLPARGAMPCFIGENGKPPSLSVAAALD